VTEELGRVLPADLADLVLWEVADLALEDELRVGPRRVGVRVVGLDDEMAVRHKGFRTTSDDMRHAFAIAPKGNVIFISYVDADNNGYIWRTTRAGVLLMTLKRDGTAMKVVPNSQAAAKFEDEKKYFLSKIPVVAKKN